MVPCELDFKFLVFLSPALKKPILNIAKMNIRPAHFKEGQLYEGVVDLSGLSK